MDWEQISRAIDENERLHPTMDIKSEVGTKVIYKYPKNGSEYESDKAAETLLYNCIYTVKKINVGQSRSDVELEEYPGMEFNTIFFANIGQEEK